MNISKFSLTLIYIYSECSVNDQTINKERQNDDIGSIETKELHKGLNESRHPQHLFYFHTRGHKT